MVTDFTLTDLRTFLAKGQLEVGVRVLLDSHRSCYLVSAPSMLEKI